VAGWNQAIRQKVTNEELADYRKMVNYLFDHLFMLLSN